MDGVDLIDQRAAYYHLDWKSSTRFYLHIFIDLTVVAFANSCIVYNMMHPNDLTLFNFKTTGSTYLIGRYTTRTRTPPDSKTGSKRKYQSLFEQGNPPPHLSEFQNIRRRFEYCYKEGIDVKKFVKWTESWISYIWSKREIYLKSISLKKRT